MLREEFDESTDVQILPILQHHTGKYMDVLMKSGAGAASCVRKQSTAEIRGQYGEEGANAFYAHIGQAIRIMRNESRVLQKLHKQRELLDRGKGRIKIFSKFLDLFSPS